MARSITGKNRCSRGHQNSSSTKKSHSRTGLGHRNYSLYINRVLKEVVPQSGISSRTLDFMNTLINNIFERISTQACNLMNYRNRRTLTPSTPLDTQLNPNHTSDTETRLQSCTWSQIWSHKGLTDTQIQMQRVFLNHST